MAGISELKFEPIGLGNVLRKEPLQVPLNQREYSWEEQHVGDLFSDISDALAESRSAYFLGTIVLNVSKDIPEVVDGQQRLATTAMLIAAMRDFLIGVDDEYAMSLNRTSTEPE
ncbi:DUF262 domain-containing protein [Planctomicrobium sp. SH661]|uniref:DUF262 domain-containing protein n=1 Tax=Planctomicrobium sp. SH661 TaxID=3448124 RepID=UPI003F5BA0D0